MMKKIILTALLFVGLIQGLMASDLNSKSSFQPNENVIVNFANMEAQDRDWIGIYPQGSSNDWDNVVAWKWTNDIQQGSLDFGSLAIGSYEARAFYHNSFTVEATTAFRVQDTVNNANLNTSKDVYGVNEDVYVNFANMSGQNKDWIGIYPQGSSNDWDNVVAWRWTDDVVSGRLNFGELSKSFLQ